MKSGAENQNRAFTLIEIASCHRHHRDARGAVAIGVHERSTQSLAALGDAFPCNTNRNFLKLSVNGIRTT